jgi:hypothetical protein
MLRRAISVSGELSTWVGGSWCVGRGLKCCAVFCSVVLYYTLLACSSRISKYTIDDKSHNKT